MKKILFIASEDKAFLAHRANLITYAEFKNLTVEIACNLTSDYKKNFSLNARYHNWKVLRGSLNPIKELNSLINLYKIVKKSNPDLIHAVSIKPVLYSGLLNRFVFRKPILFALGGLGFVFNSKKILAKILNPIVKMIMKIIFNCQNIILVLQNKDDKHSLTSQKIIKEKNVVIIPGSGVNTNEFKKKIKEKLDKHLTIMFAGRILWDKGIKEFVNLSNNLKGKFRKIKFVVVGEVDYQNPEYVEKKYIKKWKEESNIEFWGFSQDMKSTLSKADIFCFPSYREGFPKVLLEAASLEIPIVSFDVPGCRDIVINKFNGFLIKFRDETKFQKAVSHLIKSKKKRFQMGKNGRKLVEEKFSDKMITRKTFNQWKKLLTYEKKPLNK